VERALERTVPPRSARTALGRGRYDEALKSLRRHATQFSEGELEEERRGLMVLALVGHGDGAEVRARAKVS